jgi:hypothetical protein
MVKPEKVVPPIVCRAAKKRRMKKKVNGYNSN